MHILLMQTISSWRLLSWVALPQLLLLLRDIFYYSIPFSALYVKAPFLARMPLRSVLHTTFQGTIPAHATFRTTFPDIALHLCTWFNPHFAVL